MEKTVFTNGCFDILHAGHVDLLARARALGTRLVVGINSDASVRRIKGAERPFVSENERAAVLLALKSVDEVRIFDEPTPQRLIEEIEPDVLVKGGDWKIGEIVGADFVTERGGEVYSLPLKADFSTTGIVEKIKRSATDSADNKMTTDVQSIDPTRTIAADIIEKSLTEHETVFSVLKTDFVPIIELCADLIYQALARGNKVLLCGNGGSAADAQHIAAEFVGRFETERRALPSIALTTDTSALTALANDYSFERVFARQVEALAQKGDVVIGISTSGNSPNILAAIMAARERGCATIGMTGARGKKLAALCDAAVLVPAERTARIQEAHICIGHIWCEIVDRKFVDES